MANSLGNYDPLFYAQEALIHLEKALGMASRVHLGHGQERNQSFGKGSVITINKPSTFTVQDAPSSAQDLDPGTTNITLNYHREVKYKVTDKELAYTSEKIIEDHIEPAMYEVAADIDTKLNALALDIPWFHDVQSTPTIADVTASRQILVDNYAPLNGNRLHAEIGGKLEKQLLDISAFTQWQGSGQAGADSQREGFLGRRFGAEFFTNQNVSSHTSGTASTTTLALVGAHAKGATTVTLDAGTVTGTLTAGDTFVIAGSTQRYAVTSLNTASSNTFTAVAIFPALTQAYSDNAVVTLNQHGGTGVTRINNLMFHRNAFALATAPLTDIGRRVGGAQVETVERDGLSLRQRIYYMPDASEVRAAIDVLFGVKTLDANLALRMNVAP